MVGTWWDFVGERTDAPADRAWLALRRRRGERVARSANVTRTHTQREVET